jgi:hypothetical protein
MEEIDSFKDAEVAFVETKYNSESESIEEEEMGTRHQKKISQGD